MWGRGPLVPRLHKQGITDLDATWFNIKLQVLQWEGSTMSHWVAALGTPAVVSHPNERIVTRLTAATYRPVQLHDTIVLVNANISITDMGLGLGIQIIRQHVLKH